MYPFLFILTTSKASAQFKLPHFQIFANAIYASPSNDQFKNTYDAGICAEAGAGIGFGNTMLLGTLGYQSFGAKSTNVAGTLKFTSLKWGFSTKPFYGTYFFYLVMLGLPERVNQHLQLPEVGLFMNMVRTFVY